MTGAAAAPPVVNGWRPFAHSLLLDQLEALVGEVERVFRDSRKHARAARSPRCRGTRGRDQANRRERGRGESHVDALSLVAEPAELEVAVSQGDDFVQVDHDRERLLVVSPRDVDEWAAAADMGSAAEQLARLDAASRRLLVQRIDRLALDPRLGTVLEGEHDGLRRVRVGANRIVFEVRNHELHVVVVRVGQRRRVYLSCGRLVHAARRSLEPACGNVLAALPPAHWRHRRSRLEDPLVRYPREVMALPLGSR